MKTIRLDMDHIGFFFKNPNPRVHICAEELRKRVQLPADVSTIYAVFTKQSASPDEFDILPPNAAGWSDLEGVTAYIVWNTRVVLGQMYDAGYRHVRVEYYA